MIEVTNTFTACLPEIQRLLRTQVPGLPDLGLEEVATSTVPLVSRLHECTQELQRILDERSPGGAPIPTCHEMLDKPKDLQRRLTHALDEAAEDELIYRLTRNNQDPQTDPYRAVLRLRSAAEEGGAWLSCIPKYPSLQIPDQDFRQLIRLRLGLPLANNSAGIPCSCTRHTVLDDDGYHLMAACPLGDHRIRTHNLLSNTWVQLLRKAGFLCRQEDPTCFQAVGDTSKRADIVAEGWGEGRKAIFDVSVTHPWAHDNNHNRPTDPEGYRTLPPERAARAREAEKVRKYRNFIPQNAVFIPLVVETFGRWGPAARTVLHKCIDRLADITLLPKAALMNYWKQRLTVTLQRSLMEGFKQRASKVACRGSLEKDESNRLDLHEFNQLHL